MSQIKDIQTIYIRMLEGIETFIPVKAKPVVDNVFEIISNEDMDLEEDATCIYEFVPGDVVKSVVKCEMLRNFSLPMRKRRETFILAVELISSTFPNRKLYQLIFMIVRSLGKVTRNQLQGFENEIKQLCSNSSIAQRRHPVVEKWIEKNCTTNTAQQIPP